ncbi:site-specific integrase [Bizionia hallyeonensis]|uniref:Site-specific integrase n=1 Tax=Bizionia hallyeonensis TaxID=1123757 RepID=A0ABW0C5A3_9FLAO
MLNLNEFLTFEHERECNFEHDLSDKKVYSTPKIYTANGKLTSRWYVYFSFRNPITGKLERQKNIYGEANKLKTKKERLNVLKFYKKKLQDLLNQGYNPYQNNLERFLAEKPKTCAPMSTNFLAPKPVVEEPKVIPHPFLQRTNLQAPIPEKKQPESIPVYQQPKEIFQPKVEQPIIETTPTPLLEPEEKDDTKMSLREAFDFALSMKEKLVKPRTLVDYRNRSKVFIKWLNEEYPHVEHANQITRKMVMGFLNQHLIKNTPRSRNNSRVDLGSMMQVLEDNEIIPVNVIRKTPVLKAKPERHKRYDPKMLDAIFMYLEKEDPVLLLYIKFISYNFMRPIEVNRLRVKDLNMDTKTLSFKAKNSPLKTKIIPDIISEALPDLSLMDGDSILFTPDGIGKPWSTKIDNRRDYFSKRFKKIIKTKFKLSTDYGLYSFRHTFITKLYRKLAETSSPFEAKSNLMNITGHTTMTALEQYLRDIDAHLPTDYSDLLR